MKVFKLTIFGLLILYFQIIFAAKFTILGIIPNFLLAYIIYINLELEMKKSLTLAFFIGVALDLTQPLFLGLNTLSFLIISQLVQSFHLSINKKRFIVVTFSLLLLNIVFYFIYLLFYLMTQNIDNFFGLILLFAVFYNTIITLLLSYFFQIAKRIHIVLDV